MNLRNYNLEPVKENGRICSLRPINECVIDGKRYTKGELIPAEQLETGCYMNIAKKKKTFVVCVKKRELGWYIHVWEVPFIGKHDYTKDEIQAIVTKIMPKDNFAVYY